MPAIVTRESLQKLLDSDNAQLVMHVVGRALVVLFNNQTEDEKVDNATKVHNSLGFTGADARTGTLTAKSYLRNRALHDWQIEKWVKKGESGFSRLTKYHKQLNAAAEQKVSKNQEVATA